MSYYIFPIIKPIVALSTISYLVLSLWALITFISIFVPFFSAMPEAGSDPSWRCGINQTLAQGINFGKDIIFTFDSYACIYTKTYHPSVYHLMPKNQTDFPVLNRITDIYEDDISYLIASGNQWTPHPVLQKIQQNTHYFIVTNLI